MSQWGGGCLCRVVCFWVRELSQCGWLSVCCNGPCHHTTTTTTTTPQQIERPTHARTPLLGDRDVLATLLAGQEGRHVPVQQAVVPHDAVQLRQCLGLGLRERGGGLG